MSVYAFALGLPDWSTAAPETGKAFARTVMAHTLNVRELYGIMMFSHSANLVSSYFSEKQTVSVGFAARDLS